MKTITLHIGNPKTGSTSIQDTLAANRRMLERSGVLYPLDTPSTSALMQLVRLKKNHRWLVPLIEPDRDKWPRSTRFKNKAAEAAKTIAAAQSGLDRIIAKIQRSKAEHVIISSESFSFLDREAIGRLKALFAPIDAEFRVLCYYRNPVAGYLARIQQQMKASGSSRSFGDPARSISRVYDNYSAVFGEAVFIRLFDRAQLARGDVVADMLHFAGLSEAAAKAVKQVNANVSGPAELTAAQYWIRSRAFRDLDGVFKGANRQLNVALAQASAKLGLPRATLRPEASAAVLYHNRDDLRWVRDEQGLEFQDIDYGALDVPPSLDLEQADLEQLLNVDPKLRDLLVAETIRELCETAGVRKFLKRQVRKGLKAIRG